MRVATATTIIAVVVLIGGVDGILHPLTWESASGHVKLRVKRIIGGLQSPTSENRWSFAPSLRGIIRGEKDFYQCGATVISKRHLLTAAHCVVFQQKHNDNVKSVAYADELWIDMRLINDINDTDPTNYNITTKYYFHPGYRFENFANDIAIVEMPIGFDFCVEPIQLAADFCEDDGEMAFTVGYGRYNPENNTSEVRRSSYRLREGIFVFRETSYCGQTWSKPDTKRKICAGEYGRGTAKGDSGGPLMKNSDNGKWFQVGIVSYSRRNHSFDRKTYPGISTRVSFYCSWIKAVTSGEATCHPYERHIKENAAETLVHEHFQIANSTPTPFTSLILILCALTPLI